MNGPASGLFKCQGPTLLAEAKLGWAVSPVLACPGNNSCYRNEASTIQLLAKHNTKGR